MKGNEILLALFSGTVVAVLVALLFGSNADNRVQIAQVDAKVELTKLDINALQIRVDRMEQNSYEMLSILHRLDGSLKRLFEGDGYEEAK